MAFVPRVQQTGTVGTGVSSAGQISPSVFRDLSREQAGLAGAAGELGQTVIGVLKDKVDEQTEREENEWITATTGSAVSRWTLGIEDAKAAATEGAPQFTPTFMKTFDDWRPGVLESAPTQRARDDVNKRFEILRGNLFRKSLEFESRAGRAQRMASFTTAMDNYASSAAIDSALAPGLMATAEGDLAAAESTWMLPQQVTELRTAIRPNLAAAGLQGDIARNPKNVLDQITSSKPGDGSLAGFLTSEERIKLSSAARAEINRRSTATALQKNALRTEMSDISSIQAAGLDVSVDQMKAVENQVRLIGDPKMKARLRDIQQQGVAAKEMRTWTPDILQGWINDKRAGLIGKAGTQADAMLITTGEDMLQEMNTQLRNDPLIWASRSGQVIAPVAFHGDGAVESMRARRDMAGAFAADYAVETRFLTNEDERQLIGLLSTADPQQKVLVLSNIVQGFGADATSVFGRISKDNRLMAHAGGLTVEGPLQAKSAVEIVNGNEAIKSGIKVLPGATEVNQWTSEHLNGAMSMVPQTMASVIEAAKAIYTDRAVKSPPEDGDGQRDLWEDAIDAALGGFEIDGTFSTTAYGSVGQWNGFGVVLPQNTSSPDFTDLLNLVTDEDLVLASVGGAAPVINDKTRSALTADKFRKARLSSIGDGQYMVDLTHVGTDFALGSGPSGKYVFDMTKIQKVLTSRQKENLKIGRISKEEFEKLDVVGKRKSLLDALISGER